MKNPAIVSILFLLFTLLLACEKDDKPDSQDNVSFDNFKIGLLSYNDELIEQEFAKIAKEFTPVSTNSDDIGHRENFNSLIEKIETAEGLEAKLMCYACIETYPAQSELLITIDSSGQVVKRVLDIFTPSDTVLVFRTVHEYTEPDLNLGKTIYGGCFLGENNNSLRGSLTSPDSLYYTIANDTLSLNIHMNYNCCGSLIDSVVTEGEEVNIYISDSCTEDCVCRCMCEFDFQYNFTNFWQKNIHIKVFLKAFSENDFQLWGETKYINAPD